MHIPENISRHASSITAATRSSETLLFNLNSFNNNDNNGDNNDNNNDDYIPLNKDRKI